MLRIRFMGVLGLALASLCACERPETIGHWTDEALLHDGRKLDVHRSVYPHLGFGELSLDPARHADRHSFVFVHPDTRQNIAWTGELGFKPLSVDIADGAVYVVIVQENSLANLKKYGCPEIPYVFIRFDQTDGSWSQVRPSQVPRTVLTANLSPDFRPSGTVTGKRSAESISGSLKDLERLTEGYFARSIPVDFSSWRYGHRNSWRVGHAYDGCRDSVAPKDDPDHNQTVGQSFNDDPDHIQSPRQRSRLAALEVLETRTYDPPWFVKHDAWTEMAFGNERQARCRALLKRVGDDTDRPDLRGWLLFVNDPAGTKKAREQGGVFCDEHGIWFVDYEMEEGRAVLTKFTMAGDPVYRLSFIKPDESDRDLGAVMAPSFRSESGYLYFDWANNAQVGLDRNVLRVLKVRIREIEP